MPIEVNDNVGVAFALVFGAGLSTALGATVVFVPSLVKFASRRVLAASLAFSAGVMTYVSFIRIFRKSNKSFEDAGFDEDKAYFCATLCFFAGVVFMLVSEFIKVQQYQQEHLAREWDERKLTLSDVCLSSMFRF
jgi:ZIP family zinc transporter